MDVITKLRKKAQYKETFDTPAGRKVLADLIHTAGIGSRLTIGDPSAALIKEGKLFMVNRILNILNFDPDEVLNKIEESYTHEE